MNTLLLHLCCLVNSKLNWLPASFPGECHDFLFFSVSFTHNLALQRNKIYLDIYLGYSNAKNGF